MNNPLFRHTVASYEDLKSERFRLEELISHQKNIVRQDIDGLKEEIKEGLKPAVDAANFVKRMTTRETRNDTVLHIGSNLLLDVVIRKLFARSNLFVQLFVPTLVKNYSTHVLFNLMKNIAQKRQNGRSSVSLHQ